MKYISAVFMSALLLFVSASVHAQSVQSKCGYLTGSALQFCIAQWQAEQNQQVEQRRQQQQQFDDQVKRQWDVQQQMDNDMRCGGAFSPNCRPNPYQR